jgi:prevent-host-death family protein
MEVNIHHAKTNLSKLIALAESGEEVIIARNGKPTVKLVVVTPPARKSRKDMLGSGIGKIWMAEDAFSPEADREIEAMFNQPNILDDLVCGCSSTRTSSYGCS